MVEWILEQLKESDQSDNQTVINTFTGKYNFLSNFYPCTIEFDGEEYPSIEHAYQAAKTLDLDQRDEIRACNTPNKAKKVGKTVTLRKDWQKIRVSLMENFLQQKFSIPELHKKLIETKDVEIIEGNWWGDTFWGVCNGKGDNNLGKLLMKLRREKQLKENLQGH